MRRNSILTYALGSLVLLSACGNPEPEVVEVRRTTGALHLMDRPSALIEIESPQAASIEPLFRDGDVILERQPVHINSWKTDLGKPGSDRVLLLIAKSGAPASHPVTNRVQSAGWKDLERESTVPLPGELVLEQKRIRHVTGEEVPGIVWIDYPTASGDIAGYFGLAQPASKDRPSEFTLGFDSRRVHALQAPGHITYQVEVPDNAQLELAVGVRNQEYRFTKTGVQMQSLRKGNEPRLRVLIQLEDGTEAALWDHTMKPGEYQRFIDLQFDLSPWAGQVVRLRFDSAMPEGVPRDRWETVIAWAEPTITVGPDKELPNVIILLLDTLRADRLGCHGWERARTPVLDGLAKRGVRYSNASSASNWTLPSHASLFTSTHASQHGLWKNQRLPDSLPTLGETLQDGGYQTAAFAERGFLKVEHGLARGFDIFHSKKARHCRETFNMAADWMEQCNGNFFAFVHTYQVHEPYAPAEQFSKGFVREYTGGLTSMQLLDKVNRDEGQNPLAADEKRYLSDLYDAEIAELDFAIGEFTERLEKAGLLENTLLLITSDHGEEFFEHGGLAHGRSLYQEQLHVPLILYWKGQMEGGHVPEHLVNGTDVAPTAVAAAQLTAPDSWVGRPLALEPVGGPVDVFVPMRLRWADAERVGEPAVALRRGNLKYVEFPEGVRHYDDALGASLYDLDADPAELRSILDEEGAKLWAERAREMLARFPQVGNASAVKLDDDARRELEQLGYAGSDE